MIRWAILVAVGAGLLSLTSCAKIGIFAANLPSRFNDVGIQHDLVFAPATGLKLDIYTPPTANAAGHPVVVFFYGGRWQSGNKADYRFVGSALAAAGFVVVIPDYRKYPQVRFPAFIEDAAQAAAWTSDHIAAYGGNPAYIHVAGHSSGAHQAALLAADAHYMEAVGKSRSLIRSVVGLAGPYDFVPEAEDIKAIFAPPENYPAMRVTSFIDGRQPPMLLLHGGADTLVEQYNYDRLFAAIMQRGGVVEGHIYPDIDHVWMMGAISWLGQGKAPVLLDMIDFLKRQSR